MTLMEFQTAIAPAITKWPRSFSGDQIQLFHVEFKDYSFENFKKVVNYLLLNSRVGPMVDDFKRAINTLGIKRGEYTHHARGAASPVQSGDNFQYQIRDNIFADDNYIYIRGNTVRTNSFIVKRDEPNHPLVLEDREVRPSRIAEIKAQIEQDYKARTANVLPMVGRQLGSV